MQSWSDWRAHHPPSGTVHGRVQRPQQQKWAAQDAQLAATQASAVPPAPADPIATQMHHLTQRVTSVAAHEKRRGRAARPAGRAPGLLLIAAAIIGVRDILTFLGRYSADPLGVSLLLGAAALAITTSREALSRR